MIHSMTGFGRGEAEAEGHKATVELSSVNGRFMEVQFRLPRNLTALEPRFKELLGERFNRGKISCILVWKPAAGSSEQVSLNEPVAEMYDQAITQIKAKFNLSGEISVRDLLTLPDIFAVEPQEIELELINEVTEKALLQAADALGEMRRAEGEKIQIDLTARLAEISRTLTGIESKADGHVETYRQKLQARVKELFGENGYDAQRLAEEIAYIAERADITEECVRLKIHVGHFAEALESAKPVGRRMNFLLQEMNREANTIGSKAGSAEISIDSVGIKEELEKIREQIQNIE